MSYIWEDKNRGKSLYEMAIIKQKALMEASTGAPTPPDTVKFKIPDGKDTENNHKTITQVLAKAGVTPKFDNGFIELTKDDFAKCSNNIQFLCEKTLLEPNDEMKSAMAASDESKMETTREEVVKKAIETFKDQDIQNELALAVRCLMNGTWLDGNAPNEQQKQTVEHCQALLKSGDSDKILAMLKTITGLEKRGIISLDTKNPKLYKVAKPETQFNGDVQMPSMFDSEPDDTMWQDIVVTAFGIPMINMGHPVSKKVLASENPEEECPGDLKQFKKAVYDDPRLQHVFGKGGIERIIAGKLTNLLTLGIAAATVDAGKRADRIVKELKEKGGMTTHRNLLLAKYDDIVDVDPDNEGATVKVRPYNRSKGELMDEIEVPASLLKQFYAAVDPVQSSKIYLEIYGKDDDMIKALQESGMSIDGNAITEGLVSGIVSGAKAAANGAKNLGHALNTKGNLKTMFAGNDSKNEVNKQQEVDDDTKKKLANLKQQFIKKISVTGHPDAYVLKPKSANKEVDVISRSSTGQFHGGKVLMVTLKISDQNGEHTAAAFMTPNECKEYFAV